MPVSKGLGQQMGSSLPGAGTFTPKSNPGLLRLLPLSRLGQQRVHIVEDSARFLVKDPADEQIGESGAVFGERIS